MSNTTNILSLILAITNVSLILERITSYLFLPLINKLLSSLEVKWPGLADWPLKMVATTVLNMLMYALVAMDFMSPLFATIGLPIVYWQGLVMSFLVIGGGSNLVHDIFGLVDRVGRQPTIISIDEGELATVDTVRPKYEPPKVTQPELKFPTK